MKLSRLLWLLLRIVGVLGFAVGLSLILIAFLGMLSKAAQIKFLLLFWGAVISVASILCIDVARHQMSPKRKHDCDSHDG